MDAQNLVCTNDIVTWGMIPGWVQIIWKIKFMDLGLVSEVFLVKSPECLPLVPHVLLWDFPNNKLEQGGGFLIFLRFLGIITLLDNPRRKLKVQ